MENLPKEFFVLLTKYLVGKANLIGLTNFFAGHIVTNLAIPIKNFFRAVYYFNYFQNVFAILLLIIGK